MKMPKVIDFLGMQAAEFFNQEIAYHPISTLVSVYDKGTTCRLGTTSPTKLLKKSFKAIGYADGSYHTL
jgi:hypothetical protein